MFSLHFQVEKIGYKNVFIYEKSRFTNVYMQIHKIVKGFGYNCLLLFHVIGGNKGDFFFNLSIFKKILTINKYYFCQSGIKMKIFLKVFVFE